MRAHNLTLEIVTSIRALRLVWNPLFKEIFTDPGDRESLRQLEERIVNPAESSFHIIRNETGREVGMELINTHPEIPDAMYVPYAGMTEDYRNQGFYPKAAMVSDQLMKAKGIRYALYDFEDPWRIENLAKAYPDEKPEDIKARAEGRINFWRREPLSCFVVVDPEFPYLRPASDDESKIQAYDNMAIRFLDKNDPKINEMFNADRTAIKKQAYRDLYMEMTRLQFGNRSEEDLKASYPAVAEFLRNVDSSSKPWVKLLSTPVRPNARPDADATVRLADNRLGFNYAGTQVAIRKAQVANDTDPFPEQPSERARKAAKPTHGRT